jgi:hypothetical protein
MEGLSYSASSSWDVNAVVGGLLQDMALVQTSEPQVLGIA